MTSSNRLPQGQAQQPQQGAQTLQAQIETQNQGLGYFRDLADQAMRDIATIQQNEVVERVWDMLQHMAAGFAHASRGSPPKMQAPPMNAAQEQVSTVFNLIQTPIQQHRQNFVDEMLAYGYENELDITKAFDLAGGCKEFAISILVSGISFPPTPEAQIQTPSLSWDASSPNQSTKDVSSQNIAHNAPVTPVNRKRKAESSITNTYPSPPPLANSPVYSPASSSARTTISQIPATPRPTHAMYMPGSYLARRKPSSMSTQEQAALFDIVRNLAPSNKVSRFWDKVRDALVRAGFHKTEAAWKGEWSRYGTYEHGFDERTGILVTSELEKLKLLRCLDNRPRAEVKRAIQKLEDEAADVVFTESNKRQKLMPGFEGVGGGVVSADAQAWLGSLELPQEYSTKVEHVEEDQNPAVQQPLDDSFVTFDGQFPEEVEFGRYTTTEFEAVPDHSETWSKDIKFDLQDNNLGQNTDEWFSNGTVLGTGNELNLDNDLGKGFGDKDGLDVVGELNEEEEKKKKKENPYIAAVRRATTGTGC